MKTPAINSSATLISKHMPSARADGKASKTQTKGRSIAARCKVSQATKPLIVPSMQLLTGLSTTLKRCGSGTYSKRELSGPDTAGRQAYSSRSLLPVPNSSVTARMHQHSLTRSALQLDSVQWKGVVWWNLVGRRGKLLNQISEGFSRRCTGTAGAYTTMYMHKAL